MLARPLFLFLYRKYRVTLKRESGGSYRAKSPDGRDAHLAEKNIIASRYRSGAKEFASELFILKYDTILMET